MDIDKNPEDQIIKGTERKRNTPTKKEVLQEKGCHFFKKTCLSSEHFPEIYDLYNVILIRFSEIALKSRKVRNRLVSKLIRNIEYQMRNSGVFFDKVRREWGRIYLETDLDSFKLAIKVLTRVFGVYSVSPAVQFKSVKFEEIIFNLLKYADVILRKNNSFGLRVKKVGKHSFSSNEVAVKGGSQILEKFEKRNLSVNLSSPDRWIHIEVREKATYFFTDIVKSRWDGNPIELNRGALALILGKISDFISAFMLLKRGTHILPFIYNPIEKREKNTRLEIIGKILSCFKQYLPFETFYALIFNFKPVLQEILKLCSESKNDTLRCVLCRMVRLAIAEWFLQNQHFVFGLIGKTGKIKLNSNISVQIGGKRAKYLMKQTGNQTEKLMIREFVNYEAIIEGNNSQEYNFLEYNSINHKILNLSEVSKFPIFKAAITLSEEDMEESMIRIDPKALKLIKKQKNLFFCNQCDQYNQFNKLEQSILDLKDASEFLIGARNKIMNHFGIVRKPSQSVLKFFKLIEL
ncbi:MAG: THUMP domain-containing protein, partial [Promethearchaeota archaeon]